MQLLVSDFDGTLHTCDEVMEMNVKKIQDFIDQGNIFMLSSGRSYESLKAKMKLYNIPVSYMATEDGSHLFDKRGRLIHEVTMSKDILSDIDPIIELGRHKELQFGTTRAYLHERTDKDISSVNFVIDEDKINNDFIFEWEKLKLKHPDYEYLVYGYFIKNHGMVYYYCIKPKNIDKSIPVSKLAELKKLSKNSIFTIGDGDNDIPMIKEFNGFMIGDNDSLKKHAIGCYNEVYELIDDINKQKVKRR